MRLGVFGGTFDPPHIGHLILAMECGWQMQLDRVYWLLTPRSPHKPDQIISETKFRIQMVTAAINNNPLFELSHIDINRPAPHYAVDTMVLLQKQHPNDQLIYLMGEDSLFDLADWHNPLDFINSCDEIGVMSRPGELGSHTSIFSQLPGLQSKLNTVETPLIDISSSMIRHRVKLNIPYSYFVPDAVFTIIQKNSLYKKG